MVKKKTKKKAAKKKTTKTAMPAVDPGTSNADEIPDQPLDEITTMLVKKEEEPPPRFFSIEYLLRYAYAAEAISGKPGMLNIWQQNPGGRLDDYQLFIKRLTDGMNTEDIIADGAFLKNSITRHLDQKSGSISRWVLGARYRVPADENLRYLKESDYVSLAGAVRAANNNIPDKWFIADVIKGMMEGQAHQSHDVEWWARKLGRDDKTVYRYTGSMTPKHRSIKYLITLWEEEALRLATQIMVEKGQLVG